MTNLALPQMGKFTTNTWTNSFMVGVRSLVSGLTSYGLEIMDDCGMRRGRRGPVL